jgi:hypothetical protein
MKVSGEEIIEYLKTGKTERIELLKKRNQEVKTQATQNILVSGDEIPESEVHAAINPTDTNNIIISPIRMNPYNPLEALLCPIYYTKDFGKTWNKSEFKNLPKHNDAFAGGGGDPMFAFDKNGTAYLTWIHLLITVKGMTPDSIINTMNWVSSTDGGANWVRPENEFLAYYSTKYGQGLSQFYDKQWMTCDYSNSPYSNNVYLSLTHLNAYEGYNIKLYTKESGADKFNTGVRVNKSNFDLSQFTAIDVDNSGTLHVLFYANNGSTNSLYHSVSKDGGKTFSSEKKISDFVLDGSLMLPGDTNFVYIGISKQRLYPCPQMAIDKSGTVKDGNIYVTWTANGITKNEGNSLDIYFIKSSDGGATWSTPKIVNDDTKGQYNSNYYSNISVNPDGVVILSWYDRRNDVADQMTDYYMTYSLDGGNTFIENFPVTDIKTNFSTVGEINQGFGVGEYNMLLSTKGYAIPVWSDGRTGDGNMNIYTAFVPITGTVPVADNITPINGSISLLDPVPNPAFNSSSVTIKLTKDLNISLNIKDIHGNIVKEIVKEKLVSGDYVYIIDTQDLSSGDYYLHLLSGNQFAVKKLVVVK